MDFAWLIIFGSTKCRGQKFSLKERPARTLSMDERDSQRMTEQENKMLLKLNNYIRN